MGELLLGKRLGKWALAWGALLGILPDWDRVIFPLLDTSQQIAWHRGPSHSLVVMALAAWALAQGLAKLWKYQKISKAQAGCFVAALWTMHLLADCFTVEGAAVLWPFMDQRIAFNHLDPMDFLFTGPLVVTVLRMLFLRDEKQKKPRGKKTAPLTPRRRCCYGGLALSAAYVLFSVGMKFVASAGFNADLARRGVKYQRRMESPTPLNCLLWRSVVDRGDELWVGYRSVFESHQSPVRWTIYLKGKEALAGVAERQETKTLTGFTDGWWIARPNVKGAWLGDLRFQESRIWGSKKGMVDSWLPLAWTINPTAKGDPLRQISPDNENRSDFLGRMASRLVGNHQAWEANPRLAGVTGSLPEFLPVEE
jgi:inner membrane protein